ncbi:MAG: 5'-3' exonuclease H3TH domain-containing protein, partial [Ruminococcus callidus]|nr:5'-3' exonuclease H3TH domain-containing protein [Ruminococcus callidus]
MKLLAIDGNSILNRAFYGIRPLSNTQGVFTHAIFGFMNIYLKNRDEVQPDAVAVAFDLRKPTFRHKAVATYKANRKGMPEELAMQLPYVKQLLTLLGIPVITCEGYEADDILGTLAAACTAQDADCVILTGDRDSLQLVSDHVTVRLTTNKETIPYTPERFQEEYGFAPLSLIDLKALMGDSSDNISGVAGVGQKTASKLIQAWGTVENLYAHLDEAGLTKSVYNKLTAGQDAAKESKWLATIVTDVPIDMDVQHYLPQPVQTEEVRRLLLELEMAKLLEKLKLSGTDAPAAEAAEPAEQQQPLTEQPLTAALLDTWAADKMELPCCLFDGSRICVYHAGTPEAVYTSTDTALWEQLFQMPRLTFGAKPQYRFLLAQGITPDSGSPAAKDAELAAYLLNSTTSAYEVERLCVTYHVPYPRSAGEYADLAALPKLYAAMEKLVEEQGMTRLLHFEQQLTVVLAAMEHDGIAIDRQGVEDFGV